MTRLYPIIILLSTVILLTVFVIVFIEEVS